MAGALIPNPKIQMQPDQIIQNITPILVPIILAAVKQVLPRLPTWTMPALAPFLGLVIGILNQVIMAHPQNLWLAAGMGLMGVAVREVKETLLPAKNGGWPVVPPTQ